MKPGTLNAERLLALYERVADAPDAIARLRRFVLDLAVRGKLSEGIYEWDRVTLGDVGRWGSGGTPTRTNPDYYGGTIPWLVIGDLNDDVVMEAQTHITEAGLENSSAKLIEPGTVLIAMYGSIGKLGIAGIRCATNQAIAHCVPDDKFVSTEYLLLLLRSLRDQLLAKGQGIAQQNISQKILKAHPVRLPPLAEQRRIVAKVEELMALLDRLEAARTTAEANRERLTAASHARLTAPDTPPDAFSAHARFALDALPALTTRADQIKALRQTILNLAVRGKLVAATTGQLVKLGDYRTLQNGYAFKSGWFAKSGIRLLRNANIGHGQIRWDEAVYLPDERAGEFDRFRLLEGDIVLSLDRPFIVTGTKVARITHADLPSLLLQRVGRFVETQAGLTNDYLFIWVNSPHFNEQIDPGRSNGVPHISSKQVEAAEIYIPPVPEQNHIVAKIDALMALCDRLETALTAADTKKQRLLESLLHEALTPAATPRELEAAAV